MKQETLDLIRQSMDTDWRAIDRILYRTLKEGEYAADVGVHRRAWTGPAPMDSQGRYRLPFGRLW